jgi:hypothetical protein
MRFGFNSAKLSLAMLFFTSALNAATRLKLEGNQGGVLMRSSVRMNVVSSSTRANGAKHET